MVHAVAPAHLQHPLPALVLDLPVHRRAQIDIGQHLRQNPVLQPQRRVAKALQPHALQQAGIHQRAADHNLRPPWPDPRNRCALSIVHLRQPVRQPAHLRCLGHARLDAHKALRLLSSASPACWPAPRSPRPVQPPCPRSQSPNSPAELPSLRICQPQFAIDILLQPRHILFLLADRPCRNSCCSRTAPSGRLAIARMRPPSEWVISQLPPPRSISRQRPRAPPRASPPQGGSAAPPPVPRPPPHSSPSPTSPTP
jgi:hypothetical protein